MAFYEKVIKVKADVAAYLRLIAFHLHNPPVVTWGAVKGAPEQGETNPPGNWIAPPGNNRSGGGGNKAVGASGVEGR